MFKKCFWLGHNSIWKGDYEDHYRKYVCQYCGTTKCYEEPLGTHILSVLKVIGVIFLVLLVILLFCLALALILTPFEYISCKTFANQNTLPFIYKFWYGCMINYQGHWINPESLIQLLK